MMESLLAFKRAGADGVLTYFASTPPARCAPTGRPMHIVEFGAAPFASSTSCRSRRRRTASSGSTSSARAGEDCGAAAAAQRIGGSPLLDLHVKDLGNASIRRTTTTPRSTTW
jgi:hypothetical protein